MLRHWPQACWEHTKTKSFTSSMSYMYRRGSHDKRRHRFGTAAALQLYNGTLHMGHMGTLMHMRTACAEPHSEGHV